MKNYRYFVTADVIHTEKFIELGKVNHKVLAAANDQETKALYSAIVDVNSWLKPASKIYNISSNINDYLVVSVPIFVSDLPNRNGIAFPLKELTQFNPETGCVAYQTWKGKPVFQEHNNEILENAKGVIFDAILKPIPEFKGDLCEVILLVGVDKTKDAKLYNKILAKQATCYSMGAYSEDFQCSVCGALSSRGGCKHASQYNPDFKLVDNKITFLNAIGCIGFEISSVETPAFVMAQNPNVIEISNIK